MKARVVIGANFGDEGKGLMTDYLCAKQGAGVVVRFNGGAQAGHTVVLPDGRRHVFSHFGSGTLAGVPTFLSQFFLVNPIAFFKELDELTALGVKPVIAAHQDALVTTFADMIINQRKETKRGDKRHGSVGMGIHETMQRSQVPHLKITMKDLWDSPAGLEAKLAEICTRWAKYRTGEEIENWEDMAQAFLKGCGGVAALIERGHLLNYKDPVFEGAQGLLLDQNRPEFHPHVTHSNTGMRNVREICAKVGIKDFETYYVSRTYLTRHGAGYLPGEDPSLSYPDETNVDHAWQGSLRFASLDEPAMIALQARCKADFGGANFRRVLTHVDQCRPALHWANFYGHGPTRDDVEVAPHA